MAEDDDLLGGDVHEDDEEYLYNDWGVDYVDLDFKTGKSNTNKVPPLLLQKYQFPPPNQIFHQCQT